MATNAELRKQILEHLDEHSKGPDANQFVNDDDLAAVFAAELEDVRRALSILESLGHVQPANTMQQQSAIITPKGQLFLEQP